MPACALVEGMMMMVLILVMIANGLRIRIKRVQIYGNWETVFAVRMVEMDMRIDLAEVSQDEYQGKLEPATVSDLGQYPVHQWLL